MAIASEQQLEEQVSSLPLAPAQVSEARYVGKVEKIMLRGSVVEGREAEDSAVPQPQHAVGMKRPPIASTFAQEQVLGLHAGACPDRKPARVAVAVGSRKETASRPLGLPRPLRSCIAIASTWASRCAIPPLLVRCEFRLPPARSPPKYSIAYLSKQGSTQTNILRLSRT